MQAARLELGQPWQGLTGSTERSWQEEAQPRAALDTHTSMHRAASSSFPGTFHLLPLLPLHCHIPRGSAVPWNAVTFQCSIYSPLSYTALGRGNHGGSKLWSLRFPPRDKLRLLPLPEANWGGVSPFQEELALGQSPEVQEGTFPQ